MKSCGIKGCVSESCDVPEGTIHSETQPIVFKDGCYVIYIPESVFQSNKHWAQSQGFNVLGDLWENYNYMKKEPK
jgi:hypothetical protein